MEQPKIKMFIYPHTEPSNAVLHYLPRVNERVYYKGILFFVTDIWHNLDDNVIKVIVSDK